MFGVALAVSSREPLQRQAAALRLDAAGVDAKALVRPASAEGLNAALSTVGIVLAALVALALWLSLRLPRAAPPPRAMAAVADAGS